MKSISSRRWYPRPRTPLGRRIMAKYVGWLEGFTFLFTLALFAGVGYSFVHRQDDVIKASNLEIRAEGAELRLARPAVVLRTLAEPFSDVRPGQPLLEVVDDPAAFPAALAWARLAAAEDLDPAARTELAAALEARIPAAARRRLGSPAAGVFAPEAGVVGGIAQPGSALARVVDPGRLFVEGTFDGETVADARTGQPARLVNLRDGDGPLTVNVDFGPLGRASSPNLPDSAVRETLEDALRGRELGMLNDLPFRVDEVASVQVSARAAATTTAGAGAPPDFTLENPVGAVVPGRVAEGVHEATIQVGRLEPAVQAAIREEVRSRLAGRDVRLPSATTGRVETVRVSDLEEPVFVVHVKASADPGGAPTGDLKARASRLEQGSEVSRGFRARIAVEAPEFLRDRYLASLRDGRPLRAGAEIVTGSRPLALILLKR